jgi:hypothetical protein
MWLMWNIFTATFYFLLQREQNRVKVSYRPIVGAGNSHLLSHLKEFQTTAFLEGNL